MISTSVQRRNWNEIEDRKNYIDEQRIFEIFKYELRGHRRHVSNQVESCGRDDGKQKVHARARRGHQDHVATRIAECAKVHRHRLGISEQERRTSQQQQRGQQNGSEWIDMLERIEADAAQPPSSIVAEQMGYETMGRLVKCDRDHHRQKPNRNLMGDQLKGLIH